jgi:preprotein translocase subunit SecE
VAKAAKAGTQENRIVRYLRETRSELRKVIWPSREEAINLTIIVMIVMVAMSAILGLTDWVFATIFAQIIR